ncbi:MAG: 2-oxo acid dehydrogenase subunit E2 [Persicimonas sp.]
MGKHWENLEHYSSWRKISVGMWEPANDPTIYGFETVDCSRLVPYLEEVSEVSGVKVTPVAFMVKMLATIFEEFPELNVIMIGKKLRRRKSVDIFCQVALPNESAGQADLSGVKLEAVDELDIVEIATKLRSRAGQVRAGQDEEMEKTKSMVDIVPGWLMSPMLKLVDFLTFNVPIDLDWLGIRSDPFGSGMVTSVGQFDIKQGFAPLVPASRVPVVMLPGVIHKAPFVTEDGEVEGREAITVSCTFDHRCYDGYQIGHMVRSMRQMMTHPTDYFPEPDHWARESGSRGDGAQSADDEARDDDEEPAPAVAQ